MFWRGRESKEEVAVQRILTCLFFILIGSSAQAEEQHIRTPSLEAYDQCQNAAIDAGMVTKQGASISYECAGAVAQNWYNSLPVDGEQDSVSRTGGRWEYRLFGPRSTGYCAHQIEKADGSGANAYVCAIFAAAPY
jgi:hypothetical protein